MTRKITSDDIEAFLDASSKEHNAYFDVSSHDDAMYDGAINLVKMADALNRVVQDQSGDRRYTLAEIDAIMRSLLMKQICLPRPLYPDDPYEPYEYPKSTKEKPE
jgi:hypothetical protein